MSEQRPSLDTPQNWGAASHGYAEKVAPLMMRPFIEEFVDRLELDSECKALEVGAGSGIMTEVLARRVTSLLATDFAPDMIEVLRSRIESAGITNVASSVMDGQALDLEDGSYDAAASSFAVMFFPDRVKGFAELCRVLRPGSRAVVTGWAGPDQFEMFGLFLEAMRSAFPEMPPPSSPPPVFALADLSRFKSEMQAGGFEDVEVDFVSRETSIPGFETLWEALTVGAPPVRLLFDRIGSEGQERLREVLAEIVEQRFGSGPVVLSNVATVGVGRAAS